MRVAIVGAGMAGLSCAEALVGAGIDVALFDKGRGVGGRMSSRRATSPLGPVGFDHGAQYITARDPAFRAQIEAWAKGGLVGRWPAAGEDAWVGVPAMNAPLKAMSDRLDVRWSACVDLVVCEDGGWRVRGDQLDEGGFDALLTALPAEQTARLLSDQAPEIASVAAVTPSEPCWTVMAAFEGRLDFEADILKTKGPVGWAARDAAKPGRSGPEAWVIQASPDWSRDHLEREAPRVADDLLAAFFEAAGRAAVSPVMLTAHRWRYARSGSARQEFLWDPALRLGACGDWLRGPRVENAWLSGRALAARVLAAGGALGRRAT
jgi:predicted NAD/FAD-dependent oxidoreductase